jgi:hypothetical protein
VSPFWQLERPKTGETSHAVVLRVSRLRIPRNGLIDTFSSVKQSMLLRMYRESLKDNGLCKVTGTWDHSMLGIRTCSGICLKKSDKFLDLYKSEMNNYISCVKLIINYTT